MKTTKNIKAAVSNIFVLQLELFGSSFQQYPTATTVTEWSVTLLSLPTLSNQDRELHKEAVFSAHELAERRILLFAAIHV